MKITKTKSVQSLALRAGLLGIALSVAGPTMAAPPDHNDRDVRQQKREVKEARRDVRRQRRDVQRADSPQERRREQSDVTEARRDLSRERQDLRRERRDDQHPRWSRGSSSTSSQGFTGTVTRLRSGQSFDVRIGGSTFNVITSSRLPRGLNVGDIVRVHGVRAGSNDIRHAAVSIVSSR